jgi:hypothetical protein
VEPHRTLREEAVHELSDGVQARPWYQVVREFEDWYDGYRRSHIEFEGPDGETVRTRLENSYMPEYGKRYYARLKDLERGITRRWEDVTTVMLTFSASTENAEGHPRCPADHMRQIQEGVNTARKMLHKALSGRNWEYARVWEPHKSGYGHQHVAVFVEDGDDLEPEDFRPVMRSYVENTVSAGSDAHTLEEAVSLNREVDNLGSYISEYIGIFGDEVLERPIHERAFYAVAWATNTRRVDFSNGAQDVIRDEEFRRETGLRPEDRGETDGDLEEADGSDWSVGSICTVPEATKRPVRVEPSDGGTRTRRIDGRRGVDPPKHVK